MTNARRSLIDVEVSAGAWRSRVVRLRTRLTENKELYSGWLLVLTLYGAYAIWLSLHPAVISSDDALFFSRALTRFSVLDFSPQFPGYPGFVVLGRAMRLFFHDSKSALLALTISLALALPPLAAWIAWRSLRRPQAALCAFVVTLSQPLLPDLALSMMSDGAGVLFLFLGLALLAETDAKSAVRRPRNGLVRNGLAPGERLESGALLRSARAGEQRPWLAGFAFGLAACCRPSAAALLAGAFLGCALVRPRVAAPLAIGAALVGLPALVVIYALEGSLYWSEGLRFLLGHAELWGDTAFSVGARRVGWGGAFVSDPWLFPVASLALAAISLALVRLRRSPALLASIVGAFAVDLLWVAMFQNPDHLRHIAPLALLAALALVLAPRTARGLALATCCALTVNFAVLAKTVELSAEAPPPLQRAADRLAQAPRGSAVATNEGVETLRAQLQRLRVYDTYYEADSAFGLATAPGAAYRLSTSRRPSGDLIVLFPGRFAGEKTLYLYEAERRSP